MPTDEPPFDPSPPPRRSRSATRPGRDADPAPARAAVRARRGAGDLSSLSKEIYSAPPGSRPADAPDARVTVSTRLRKPRVHLTAPPTVAQVDLPRYMGRWYEIARLPYFTQRRCVGDVQADYVLGADGMVYVTNRCAHADGGVGTARGVARVLDTASNARLEISFRQLYGVNVFWDDYWVVGLGAGYEYALVGQPTRKRGWVLAREPRPAEADVAAWLAEFASRGFPAEAFIRTRQAG